MDDDAVFLVTELWITPDTFSLLKTYRKKVNDILAEFRPEYIFHSHAFEWVYGGEGENYPTGIEIIRFESESIARSAISALNTVELKNMENKIFERVRCYISRYAFPKSLTEELYSQAR